MSTESSHSNITVEDYLSLERKSEERHEYLDGVIFAMAGESPEYGTICTNLVAEIRNQLKGSRCQAWSKDFKVRSGPTPDQKRRTKGLYSFPDLVVFCGEPEFHDEHRDVLTNPAVVIEVLSPATEAFDRGEKFLRYQNWNPTLTDYVLVSQSMPVIEHFSRRSDGGWSYHVYQDLSDSLTIQPINCTLSLAEVFDRIEFQPESSEEDSNADAG
ncbi:MAG: Uma2 family endonuclease [Acidobacteriota bacterium]|nr:MAG: Uma2 family endonuclease [Acidobacteriota bacterium]